MKITIKLQVEMEFDSSLSAFLDFDEPGKEELKEMVKDSVEDYFLSECIGYQNENKLKVTVT
jgi:hypothetical protein